MACREWRPEAGQVLVTDGGELARLHAGPNGRLVEYAKTYVVEYENGTLAAYVPPAFFARFRLDAFQAWGSNR